MQKRMIKVLLIEDEPLARWVERKSLEDLGCMVVEAETCAHAMSVLQKEAFDLIVSDHRLPDGLGRDVIVWLRRLGRADPAIYLTAEVEAVTSELRKELVLDAVLGKPLNPEALRDAVASVLERMASGEDACMEEGSAGRTKAEMVGPFHLVRVRETRDREPLLSLRADHADLSWIALDLSELSLLKDDSIPVLKEWAAACRIQGGRLAVSGMSDSLVELFVSAGLDKECDLVESIQQLEAIGRRLSSGPERTALLGTVVTRVGGL